MGKYDPEHHTKLVIDEWGTWYRGGTELGPDYILSQTITLRDALHAAMTFDIFNRHADKIEMANVAQTINCLHSLFAAVGDKYTRTPAYYDVRDVSPAHGRRGSCRRRFDIPDLTVPLLEGEATLPGLSGSASVRDKGLTVTLTNPSLQDARGHADSSVGRRAPSRGRATVLTHADMHATNTFEKPHRSGPGRPGGPGVGGHGDRHHSEAGGRRDHARPRIA